MQTYVKQIIVNLISVNVNKIKGFKEVYEIVGFCGD